MVKVIGSTALNYNGNMSFKFFIEIPLISNENTAKYLIRNKIKRGETKDLR